MSASNDAQGDFWAFALEIYMQPEARAAFLRMQDEAGFDVPLALWCLWCDARLRPVDAALMRRALRFSQDWRAAFVEPVRALRTGWKGGVDPFDAEATEPPRQVVAKTEQTIERLQMDQLAAMAEPPDTVDRTPRTLSLYARIAELKPDTGDVAVLSDALASHKP